VKEGLRRNLDSKGGVIWTAGHASQGFEIKDFPGITSPASWGHQAGGN